MKVLIVSATDFEILPILNEFGFSRPLVRKGESVKLESHSVDILITGVGINQMAFHLGRVLSKSQYKIGINLGIGGSFTSDLEKGDVVSINEEIFSDLGAEAEDGFRDLQDLKLLDASAYPFTEGKLVNSKPPNLASLSEIQSVRAVTVNTVLARPENIQRTCNMYTPKVASMEGAAFFYAMLYYKIQFLELRAISDMVGETDRTKWKIHLAIERLNIVGKSVIKEIIG